MSTHTAIISKAFDTIVNSWKTAYSFSINNDNRTAICSKKLEVIFPAFMILESTQNLKKFSSLQKEIAYWLLKQQSLKTASFNWWHKKVEARKQRPYPDDLDDTFCSWSALHQLDPQLITPQVLSKLTKLLISQEKQEGGPYRTWLADITNAEWQNYDPIVNCNIAYFLAKQHIFLQNQLLYIKEALDKNFISPYYSSLLPCMYFFSRLYNLLPSDKQMFFHHIAQHAATILQTQWNNIQQTPHYAALTSISLFRLGYRDKILEEAKNVILKQNTWGFGEM